MTLSMSFDARDYLGPFPPPELSLRGYEKFFSDPYLLKGLKTSLQLAALTAIISTALGVAAAVALDRLPRRSAEAAIALFLSPLIVPGVVIGFALLLFYARTGMSTMSPSSQAPIRSDASPCVEANVSNFMRSRLESKTTGDDNLPS